MSTKQPTTLENLRLALYGVTAPFSCEGEFVPENLVTLVFKDGLRQQVRRETNSFETEKELAVLFQHCRPAPFGAGKTTRYDRRVRHALQLKAEKGAFTVEDFDPATSGILATIQRELVPQAPGPISAELYAVNVYSTGGHFAPHKDTPRGSDMFGTLVVCLPTEFSGGRLVLNHRGVVQKFDWGRIYRREQTAPNLLQWAAFFGDVDHQIERVRFGHRVTLTYLLRHGAGEPIAHREQADPAPLIQSRWCALLADPSFLPKGGILAYPCGHLYHQDARFQQTEVPIITESAMLLKGRDHLAAATAVQAGLKVAFVPYLFENCADEVWQLHHLPTTTQQSKLRSRRQLDTLALKAILPIRAGAEDMGDFALTWLEPPPTSDNLPAETKEGTESAAPPAVRLHHCEYSQYGYFGNEGSIIDLYTYAALHFEIPPFGTGPRVAAAAPEPDEPEPTPVKRKRAPRKRKE